VRAGVRSRCRARPSESRGSPPRPRHREALGSPGCQRDPGHLAALVVPEYSGPSALRGQQLPHTLADLQDLQRGRRHTRLRCAAGRRTLVAHALRDQGGRCAGLQAGLCSCPKPEPDQGGRWLAIEKHTRVCRLACGCVWLRVVDRRCCGCRDAGAGAGSGCHRGVLWRLHVLHQQCRIAPLAPVAQEYLADRAGPAQTDKAVCGFSSRVHWASAYCGGRVEV
jgi:hypothetical protein